MIVFSGNDLPHSGIFGDHTTLATDPSLVTKLIGWLLREHSIASFFFIVNGLLA